MFWLLPLAGAALGAMSSKDKLKGALLGAGLGATGGAGAGLLGAGAAAGGAAAGGAAAGGASGLLGAAGGTGLAGGLTAATGAGTALTGATGGAMGLQAGLGAGTSLASATAAPAMTAATGAGTQLAATGAAPGLLSQAAQYAKPVMQAVGAAQQTGLLGGEQEQAPPPQIQSQPLDLGGILQGNQQSMQMTDEEAKRRQKELEMYAMNMMGGRNV